MCILVESQNRRLTCNYIFSVCLVNNAHGSIVFIHQTTPITIKHTDYQGYNIISQWHILPVADILLCKAQGAFPLFETITSIYTPYSLWRSCLTSCESKPPFIPFQYVKWSSVCLTSCVSKPPYIPFLMRGDPQLVQQVMYPNLHIYPF